MQCARPRQVRATGARGQTLLHYVAREVARHRGGAAPALASSLPSIPAAGRLSAAALQVQPCRQPAGLQESVLLMHTRSAWTCANTRVGQCWLCMATSDSSALRNGIGTDML